MKIVLETNKLLFREFKDSDFDGLQKVLIKNDDEYVKRWISWCKDSYRLYGFGHWAVIYKETGELIGSIGLSMQYIDDEWKPEIGYHLKQDYRKRGLAKEAAIAIRDYYFTHFDGDEVYSYMNQDNVASYKTAEAMGMKFDHFYLANGESCRVYKITRNEWKSMKNPA